MISVNHVILARENQRSIKNEIHKLITHLARENQRSIKNEIHELITHLAREN
jgi:hypothetical protein